MIFELTYSNVYPALVQAGMEQGSHLQAAETASALTRWLRTEPKCVREAVVVGRTFLKQGERNEVSVDSAQPELSESQSHFALNTDRDDADALLRFAQAVCVPRRL